MKETVKVSKKYKHFTRKTILSILEFSSIYLLMIIFSLVLILATLSLTYYAFLFVRDSWLIFLSLLTVVSSIIIFLFLFKFLFKKNKILNQYNFEITEKDHPIFFQTLHTLADDMKVNYPQKVFLIPDVNAQVFLDSGIWGTFFNPKMNLAVGVGLINSTNISQFKFVLAHELGHLSQGSAKLGFHVSNITMMLHHFVFEEDRWDEWANNLYNNRRKLIMLFSSLIQNVTNFYLNIFKKYLKKIKLNYSSLSREMEFMADEIAVNATGSNNASAALWNTVIGDIAFGKTFYFMNKLGLNNKKIDNFFVLHKYELENFSNVVSNLENNVVDLPQNSITGISLKDDWADHPDISERIKNIQNFEININEINDSSWGLFNNPLSIQFYFTKMFLRMLGFDSNDSETIDLEQFKTFVKLDSKKELINQIYNGFYDNRFLIMFNLESAMKASLTADLSINIKTFYSIETAEAFKKLNLIYDKYVQISNFNNELFSHNDLIIDGNQLSLIEFNEYLNSLRTQIDNSFVQVSKLEIDSFIWNYRVLGLKDNELSEKLIIYYQQIFSIDHYLSLINDTKNKLNRYFIKSSKLKNKNRQLELILLSDLCNLESELIDQLKEFERSGLLEICNENLIKLIRNYLSKNIFYFKNSQILKIENIPNLWNFVSFVFDEIYYLYPKLVKSMTDFQYEHTKEYFSE